jgi:hypothetical protein
VSIVRPRGASTASNRHARSAATVLALASLLVTTACSDDGPSGADATTSTAPLVVGDRACEDLTGDVYLTSDPEARPTGRAEGIDLVHAEVVIADGDLRVTFETVAPVLDVEFPELIAFGGSGDDANRFEIRAVGSAEGWAVRRVTFVDGAPTDAALDAQVQQRGTAITFTVRAGLFPIDDFVAFAFASTGNDAGEAVNDECFPFADRAPQG